MNRLYAPNAIPLSSSERVDIQGKEGNISVMTVAISDINNFEYIGIGSSLTAPPSHTTQHPPQADCAIRLIPDSGIASRTGKSRSRGTKVQVI
jgi:hypothetical protein